MALYNMPGVPTVIEASMTFRMSPLDGMIRSMIIRVRRILRKMVIEKDARA